MQKLLTKFLLICAPSFALSSTLQADDDRFDAKCEYRNNNIILDYDGEKFKDHTILPLKSIIDVVCRDTPDLRDFVLRKVIVIAKSKRSYGAARLQVGRSYSRPYLLNDDYRPVHLRTPRRQGFSRGPWRLSLEGKIKVKELIIKIEEAF